MMIKWIVCAASNRDAFDAAQRIWERLRYCDGLVGQIGGWDEADANRACILGIWRDAAAYERFFAHVHDAVTLANGQAASYESISVTVADAVVRMPGAAASLRDAIAAAGVLRVADCKVGPGRRDHFVGAQLETWTPEMAEADGMLGGIFSVAHGDPSRYLVTTLWRDQAAHATYVRDRLPDLRSRAAVDGDLVRLDGTIVPLEPGWRVVSA